MVWVLEWEWKPGVRREYRVYEDHERCFAVHLLHCYQVGNSLHAWRMTKK